jgi:hypothetical protein
MSRTAKAVVAGVVLASLFVGVALGFVLDGDDRARSMPSASESTSATSPETTSPPETASTTAIAATTEPEQLTAASRFHVRGVGPIEAGMTVREAERVVGGVLTITAFDIFEGRCYYARLDGPSRLSFVILAPGDGSRAPSDPKDGIIGRVSTSDPQWRTVSGAHVGSTIEEVRRLHPGRLRDEPHQYYDMGRYLTVEPPSASDRDFGIRFEVGDSQVVDVMHSGRADVISYVEGCA